MRIIHVLHSHGYGGAENHVLLMMRGQRLAGHDVMFAGPLDSWLGKACAKENIPAEHIPMHGLFDLASHWKLRRLARKWRADLVHGHLIRGAMYAGLAGHKTRTPLSVCTAHATTAKTHMQRCGHIIAVSDAVRQNLVSHGYDDSGISIIHNGVPDPYPNALSDADRQALRNELNIPTDITAVVHAGRFIHDKGQDLLIESLRETPDHVHFYLIGDTNTPFGQQMRRAGQDSKRLHFLGFRADVQRILPAFDIYAMPSRREALPLALIEAFAARLPTIASRVGGVPEILQDEASGLLIPPDDAQSLATAINRLQGNKVLARHLAESGRSYYEQHLTDQCMVEQTLAVYQRCLDQARHV